MTFDNRDLAMDEEQLLSDQPLAPPPRRLGRAARLAGGLAASALVAAGTSHWMRASEPQAVEPEMGPVGLAEQTTSDLPDAPSMKSFIKYSKPYMGGKDLEIGGDKEAGKIKINADGRINEYYLPGAETIRDHTSVKFTPPYRFYLMKEPTVNYSDATKFYKPQLIGKTFTVDMDMNGASCGCNLNFYLVDMPVADAGKDGDYYCDAQCFPGKGCWAEFDMNEGNDAVQQITNHACTNNYAGHPDWACHKWGDPMVKTDSHHFGLGASGVGIDSSKPFTFAQKFEVVGQDLVVTTTLSQNGTQHELKMGPSSQLNAMWKSGSLEKGMAFVTGYWHSGDMNWFDGETCGTGPEHCNKNPAYISHWRITTNAKTPPTTTAKPAGAGNCHWWSCEGTRAEDGRCSESEDHCKKCGDKSAWCH